jgi:hypothetical protein
VTAATEANTVQAGEAPVVSHDDGFDSGEGVAGLVVVRVTPGLSVRFVVVVAAFW